MRGNNNTCQTHKQAPAAFPGRLMKQRTSSRTVKVSKAFQVVDDDTRRSNQEHRLLALEQNNYNEKEVLGLDNVDDDAYQESDVCQPVFPLDGLV